MLKRPRYFQLLVIFQGRKKESRELLNIASYEGKLFVLQLLDCKENKQRTSQKKKNLKRNSMVDLEFLVIQIRREGEKINT